MIPCLSARVLYHSKHKLSFRYPASFHGSGDPDFPHRTLNFDRFCFHYQSIAGFHRAPELGTVNSCKNSQLSFIFYHTQEQNPSYLSHRLHNEGSRHNRVTRKMSLKERFIITDAFDPHSSLTRLQLEDPIYQKKRIAVGQDVQDFFDFQFSSPPLFKTFWSFHHHRVLLSDEVARDGQRRCYGGVLLR